MKDVHKLNKDKKMKTSSGDIFRGKVISRKQPYPKIALIGFRGVGKSSIATSLSQSWDTDLISLDNYIEQKSGMTIQKMVDTNGWGYFRQQEALYLDSLSKSPSPFLLLDLGGGIIEDENKNKAETNVAILKRDFFTIYITMNKEKNIDRLVALGQSKYRPDAIDPVALSSVYDKRRPFYIAACHAIVDVTDLSIIESAQRIQQLFKLQK